MYQPEAISALLKTRQSMQMLHGKFYNDNDIHEADLDLIYHREWIFAGHTFELDKLGTYFTLQIGHYPVFVARDRDGSIRAFHNVCRHRGSRVRTDAKGRASRIVCPYHQWMYSLDGQLLSAPNMGTDIDKSRYDLKPVACEIINTHIFLCVNDNPPDITAFRDTIAPYLLPMNLENAKVAFESTIVENGNWKLVWENNRECYHCNANHPELLKSFLEDSATVAGNTHVEPSGDVKALWDRCNAAGLPSSMVVAPNNQYRATRVPMIDGTSSFTMTGQPAVTKPLVDTGEDTIGDLLVNHYPSTWNHFMADHAVTFRVLPLGPHQTELTTKWLVHKDAVEGVDYDLDTLTAVWKATNREDQRVVEEAARGASSPAFEPGPFSETMEYGVEHFLGWYDEAMRTALER